MLLSQLNNAVAKELVAKMIANKLSAKSINTYFGLVKIVVASAVNDEGDELFPRKWNHEFIGLPVVDHNEQRKPTFTSDSISLMLDNSDDEQLRTLIILAAASGMRLGEILGLSIRNVSTDGCTIAVAEKAYAGDIEDFLKTKNGKRMVDLDSKVGEVLRKFIGNRKGLVFATRTGKPLSQSNILKRQLHPLLEELDLPKCGAHAFRRYRTTWLRKQRTPEGWMGHAGQSITDGYDRVREDVEFRKRVAKAAGFGFTIPEPKTVVGQTGQEISAEVFQEVAVSV